MKIDLIISTIRGGGAERVMSILCNKLQSEGHEVRLITFREAEEAYPIDQAVQRVKLSKKTIPVAKLNAFYHLIAFYSEKTNRPDQIISFLTLMNLVAILAGNMYGIPVIVSEHNNHLQLEPPAWLTRFTWRWIYRRAKFVTVLTSFDVSFFVRRQCKVEVMPNPCSFIPATNYNANRRKEIIAVGNLDRYHHKGFDNLLEIVYPVLCENREWKLRIIGEGTQGKQLLEKRVSELEMERQIEFLGFRKDVREILQNASIFILPSRFEGLPMVLLEALSQGAACLAYDCITGPSDMIQDRINGLLIEDQNMSAMRIGLKTLIEDADLRESLGQNGMDSLERYSLESIYQRWMDLLSK